MTKMPAVAPDLARLLAELARLGGIAPDLVTSEVRPLVAALQARERTCDGCGQPHVQKQRHHRGRSFHAAACRVRHTRQGG